MVCLNWAKLLIMALCMREMNLRRGIVKHSAVRYLPVGFKDKDAMFYKYSMKESTLDTREATHKYY